MNWLRFLHNRLNVYQKVLIANAIMLSVGILGGSYVTKLTYDHTGTLAWPVLIEFLAAGINSSLVANYLFLRLAFEPAFRLQNVMEQVRAGNFGARVPAISGDPAVVQLAETFNVVLDRLEERRQMVASQVLRALEEERLRIARELHDETSQSLSALLIHLEMIEQGLSADDPLRSRAAYARELSSRTLDEVRRLMHDLRPSVLDHLGLVPALRWYTKNRIQALGLEADLKVEGLNERLPEAVEVSLYRLVQEAVSNALKHAGATRVTVSVKRMGGRLSLRITDNGQGFAVKDVLADTERRGLGLTGMQERVDLLGGRLQIDSSPSKGTVVNICIPVAGGEPHE